MELLDNKGAIGNRLQQTFDENRVKGYTPEKLNIRHFSFKNTTFKLFSNSGIILAFIVSILLSAGCENSMEKIKTITKSPAYPSVSRVNTEIFYSDSSRVKVRVWAPKLDRFTQTKEPYIDFPEGITVYFYDTAMNIQSEVTSHKAIYYEKKNLWIARDDVIVKNNKGEQLNTEELYWDQNSHKIYSEKFTRIQSADGVTIGENGFEANQDFTWWRLKSGRGTFNLKDES